MEYYGAIYRSDGVSDAFIVTLTNSKYSVSGYISQGAAMNLAQSWDAPFGNNTLGSVAGAIGNAEQVRTGKTSVSRFNTVMVWEGGQPPTITLPVTFLAQNDPVAEVHGAIAALFAMASPTLNETKPSGRIPELVVIDIGRTLVLTGMVIQDLSIELDAPKSSAGYFIRNNVNIQLCGAHLFNSDEYLTSFQL